ncbi:MAG: ACP S-malonyltransferase, partial [Treponema sp.]|nr:ACP S-malonyltransferase [Treponema sp.]
MQKVCEEIAAENKGHAPGMSAILGLPPDSVKKIADAIPNAYAANMNSSKQTVVSGTFDALTEMEERAMKSGARRAIRLKVAGPFHSPLMQRAADEFEKVLAPVEFKDPQIPLFSNVTGKRAMTGAEIKESAVQHLTHGVLWTDEEAALASMIKDDAGEWAILEPGPGKVLAGLWSQTEFGATLPAIPVGTAETVNSL